MKRRQLVSRSYNVDKALAFLGGLTHFFLDDRHMTLSESENEEDNLMVNIPL